MNGCIACGYDDPILAAGFEHTCGKGRAAVPAQSLMREAQQATQTQDADETLECLYCEATERGTFAICPVCWGCKNPACIDPCRCVRSETVGGVHGAVKSLVAGRS